MKEPLAAPPSEALGDSTETWIQKLVHDLRQPLSNIQSCVCLLKLILPQDARVLAKLDMIEQQVDEAALLLTDCLASLSPDHRSTEAAAEMRSFTKATTAELT